MDGQAEASNSIGDLANFLGGEVEKTTIDDENEQDEEVTQDGTPEESDEEVDEGESSEDESEDEKASGDLIEVTYKGENGEDVTEKVDQKELVSGYMREKAFTQKTMQLAEDRKQVITVAQSKIDESQKYFTNQALLAREAVMELAGMRSEQDLYRLSVEDPAAWIAEQQRMTLVNRCINNLDQDIQKHNAELDSRRKQIDQEQVQEAWKVLETKGMTRDKLAEVYLKVGKDYGVSNEDLGKILNPGIALALRDAIAYRELQNKKPQIANKVKSADNLPSQKKAIPQLERVNRGLNEKFKTGKAKLNDLSSFLLANKM
jgi:flagellar biosynthesis chaperone FliJ